MFAHCSLLTSLDLSNFDTSNVQSMANLFSHCHKLESLDVSNFNTSLIKSMNKMFDNCLALHSLDLSNFDTSNVNSMESMLSSCKNLEFLYINILNSNITFKDIFKPTKDNFIICGENGENLINDLNLIDINIRCNISNPINEFKCFTNKNGNFNSNNYACNICGNNASSCYIEIKHNFIDETKSVQYTNQITENFNFNTIITNNFISQTISTIEFSKEINDNELTTVINEIINKSSDFYSLEESTEIIHEKTEINNGTIFNYALNETYANLSLDLVEEQETINLVANKVHIIENKTENIKNIINNLINDFNITEIDDGKD